MQPYGIGKPVDGDRNPFLNQDSDDTPFNQCQQIVDTRALQGGNRHGIVSANLFSDRCARFGVQCIDLVEDLDDMAVANVDVEIIEHFVDIFELCHVLAVADVPNMQDDIGLLNLFKCRAEGRNEMGRQIRDEAHRIRQDDPGAAG